MAQHSEVLDALGLIIFYAIAMALIAVPFKWFHLINTTFTVSAKMEANKKL